MENDEGNSLQSLDELLSHRLRLLEEIATYQENTEFAQRNVAIIRYLLEDIKINSLNLVNREDILISQVTEATDIVLENMLAKFDPGFREAIIALMEVIKKNRRK